MKIREATLGDSERINNLVYDLAEKYIADVLTPDGAETLLSSMKPKEIKKYIQSGFTYHIAEIDGRLVGVAGFRDNSHYKQGIAGELWRVALELCLSKRKPRYIHCQFFQICSSGL